MSGSEGIGALERGEDPDVLHRMRTGWAVIGRQQHLPGYCLLIHESADELTDLPAPERAAFLQDMSLLGEAVKDVCAAADPAFYRVNYEILGNSWNHLHAHVHARYHWEPEERRRMPVWLYGDARHTPADRLGPAHTPLRTALSRRLAELTGEAYG